MLPEVRDCKKARMAFTLRKSVKAISITSITTSLAFFANSFSAIMPIASFGIFAGTIVLVNFIIISLFFPPLIIYYEETVEPFKIRSKQCLKNKLAKYIRSRNPNIHGDEDDDFENSRIFEASIFWRMLYAYSKTSTEPYQNSGKVSHFIKTTWNNYVRKFRWAIIGISLACCVIFITNASNLDG